MGATTSTNLATPEGSTTAGPGAWARVVEAARPYDFYMLLVSVCSLLVLAASAPWWALETSTREILGYADTTFCFLFFLDFLRSLARAPSRMRYLRTTGWLDLASSVPTIAWFRLGRVSRIARLIRLMRAMRSFRVIGLTISRHKRESALLAAGVVSLLMLLFSSIAILEFERAPASNIRNAGDALWWAFSTITMVGYGDHYPVTLEGRLTAAMLMAAGVGLFGTLSGVVASWFLQSDQSDSSVGAGDDLRAELAALREAVERRLSGHDP